MAKVTITKGALRRAGWFLALWLGSLFTVAALAYTIRLFLNMAG